MLIYVIGLLLLVHGLAHITGVVGAFSSGNQAFKDLPWILSNSEPIAQTESMAVFLVGKTKILILVNYVANRGDLPPDNHVAFGVDDVDSACRRLVEHDVTREVPPSDYYWGRSAYLRDPGGLLIEITQTPAGGGDGRRSELCHGR